MQINRRKDDGPKSQRHGAAGPEAIGNTKKSASKSRYEAMRPTRHYVGPAAALSPLFAATKQRTVF